MQIIIYEDDKYDQFYPLSLNRATFFLKCGLNSFLDKIIHSITLKYPEVELSLLVRDELENIYRHLNLFSWDDVIDNESYFFISGSVIFENEWDLRINQCAIVNKELVAFHLNGTEVKKLKKNFFFKHNKLKNILQKMALTSLTLPGKIFNYLFEILAENNNELRKGFNKLPKTDTKINQFNRFSVVGDPMQVYVHEDANIYPEVSFIVETGPIIIDAGAIIKPFTLLEGPCYIGQNTLVDGAKIRGGTSIFEGCKVAGEIESSIILEYSNKHHDGFLGHAYIGAFVNFGAMSTNSDLKNNYGKVTLTIHGEKIKTNSIKVGAFIGDHTKLGIGSLINTGSVIGIGCNLFFEGEMYPKYIPSFSWGGKYPFKEYKFDQFLSNCQKVLKRRNQLLSQDEQMLFYQLFQKEKKIIKILDLP